MGNRDTLTSVAARFDTTPSELTSLNKLNSSFIYAGQQLFVPDKSAASGETNEDGDSSTTSTKDSPTEEKTRKLSTEEIQQEEKEKGNSSYVAPFNGFRMKFTRKLTTSVLCCSKACQCHVLTAHHVSCGRVATVSFAARRCCDISTSIFVCIYAKKEIIREYRVYKFTRLDRSTPITITKPILLFILCHKFIECACAVLML